MVQEWACDQVWSNNSWEEVSSGLLRKSFLTPTESFGKQQDARKYRHIARTITATVWLWGEQSKDEAKRSVAEEVKRKETVLNWDNLQVYPRSGVQVMKANKFPYCIIFLGFLLFVARDITADWENQSKKWYFKNKIKSKKKKIKQLKENTVKDYIHRAIWRAHWVGRLWLVGILWNFILGLELTTATVFWGCSCTELPALLKE